MQAVLFTKAPLSAQSHGIQPARGQPSIALARRSLRSLAVKEPHDGAGPFDKPPPSAAEAEALERAKEDKNLRDLPSQAGQAGVQRSARKEPSIRGEKYPNVEDHLRDGKSMMEAIEAVREQRREQEGMGVKETAKKLN